MTWTELRHRFPDQWLLVEATRAHTEGDRRVVEDLAVVEAFRDGGAAMRGYSAVHRESPQRELYVLHTDRETLEIGELSWLGLRNAV